MPQGSSRVSRVFTVEEVERFAAAFDERFRPFVLVLAYGGLRPGRQSHCAVAISMISGGSQSRWRRTQVHGKLVEGGTKMHKARLVPLPATVVTILWGHLAANTDADPEGPMFTTPAATRIRLTNFRSGPWKQARVRAELPDWLRP